MRLARGTSPWFYAAWGLTIPLTLGAILWNPILWAPTAPVLALALLMLNFFRDPERPPGEGIVAPADGVIQFIEPRPEGGLRIATFMNPFDVHVNRAPLDAVIRSIEHRPGGFLPAFKKESERNERVVWELETEIGDVRLVQIAGALARRILPYMEPRQKVKKGDRIGIIRLGSRVDIYLPEGVEPLVKVGERVYAGRTTFARLP